MTTPEDAIGSLLAQCLADGHARGVVVAVTDRERVRNLVSRGSSGTTDGAALGPDSLIRLGSLSKSFAALVVLQEIERGRLNPQTRVSEIVPWCELPEPYGPLLLHHLLTHTAGLPRGSDASIDPLFAVQQLRRVEPASAPGEHFHYSNDGWKLIGVLLEEVTGEPLERLIRDRVLEPLGMTGSVARIEAEQISALVPRFGRLLPGRPLTRRAPLVELLWTPYSASDGCVAATVDDMCRYARMLLGEGRTPTGERIVAPDTWELLVQPWVRDDETGWYGGAAYGYGWWVLERDGAPVWLHPGYQPGSSCMLIIEPTSGLAAFAAANGVFDVHTICEYALAAVRADLTGKPPPARPRVLPPTRIVEAADYAGEYRGDGHFTLTPDGDGLRFDAGEQHACLEQVDPTMRAGFRDAFVVPIAPYDQHLFEFERAEDGTVVRAGHGRRRFGRVPHAPDEMPLPAGWESYCGTYRSWNPTIPMFTVAGRRGRLWLLDEWETVPLNHLREHSFCVGDPERSPERLHFDAFTPSGATRVVAADGEGAWYRISDNERDEWRHDRA